MRPLTTVELQRLVGQQEPPCVSIYLPTHRHHPGTEQERIRFKNLLAQAASLLRSKYHSPDVGRFLEPVEALSTTAFWQHQEDGLAVFCAPSLLVHYRLPVRVPELVVVSNTFHTKPLVGYLNSNRHYFVLSLSTSEARLYEGTPHTLAQVEVESLAQVEFDPVSERGASSSLFVRGGSAGSGQTGVRPGHGPGDEDHKKALMKYFRAVDRALWPILREERSPLVLAAVSYYHPLFLAASRYPYVLGDGIEGNVEHIVDEELRLAAYRLVAAYEEGVEKELAVQYASALRAGRASNDLGDIARAAAHGRIQVLLHEAGRTIWGHVDPSTGEAVVHSEGRQQDADDADIIDDLCEMTLLKGGEVFEVSTRELLHSAPLGAIYRY